MNRRSIQRRLHNLRPRKGAIIVLAAMGMMILFVAAAFSVDIAYMQLTREELHIATDAAAKAAVAKLSVGGSQTDAKNAAVACAAANTVAGRSLTISPSDVTLGKVTYVQNGHWTFAANQTPTTAATVNVTMSNLTVSGPVNLFFGRLLGTAVFQPTAASTAAFVRNKVCLTLDRSHSMCFDLSGVEWKYPTGIPADPNGRKYPPDATGSRWAKLANAVSIFLNVVKNVPVETQIGLVTWSDTVNTGDYWTSPTRSPASPETTLECTFSNTYDAITTAITTRGSSVMLGGTDMAAGMNKAMNLFTTTDDGLPWNKVIILLSDGNISPGCADPTPNAYTAKSAGIVIHTVGLLNSGAGSNLLHSIADITGGQYFYAPDAASLNAAFEKIARLLPVILTQ